MFVSLHLQLLDKEGQLPPVLILQGDNCGRENKNKCVMMILAMLVEICMFQRIELYFLPVGHTHAEIDQRWSVLSRFLNNVDTLTFSQLRRDALEAFKSSDPWVVDIVIDRIIDFEVMLSPFTKRIHGLGTSRDSDNVKRRVHCIQFLRSNNQTCFQYKEFDSSSEEWQGLPVTNAPIPFFLGDAPMVLPDQLVLKAREGLKNLEEVEKKVKALKAFMPHLHVNDEAEGVVGALFRRIREANSGEWDTFLKEEAEWMASEKPAVEPCTRWSIPSWRHNGDIGADASRALAQLEDPDHVDNRDDKVPFVSGRVQVYMEDKPASKYTFDPEKNTVIDDVVLLLMEKEGTTNGRGWELGVVTDLQHSNDEPLSPIVQVNVTYMQPARGDWAGEWFSKPLRKIYNGRHEWWDELPAGVVRWSFPLTKQGRIRKKNLKVLLPLIADCESYHRRNPGARLAELCTVASLAEMPGDVETDEEDEC